MKHHNPENIFRTTEADGHTEPYTFDKPAWQDQAACRYFPLEMFFPERGGDGGEAKAVCKKCPVKEECLEFALGHHIVQGIWGGMSERQRRVIRKERHNKEMSEGRHIHSTAEVIKKEEGVL